MSAHSSKLSRASVPAGLAKKWPPYATAAVAIAANARLALYGGGDFLENQLAKLLATPKDLANAVGALADTLQQLRLDYLADANDDAARPLRSTLTTQIADVNKLCKS